MARITKKDTVVLLKATNRKTSAIEEVLISGKDRQSAIDTVMDAHRANGLSAKGFPMADTDWAPQSTILVWKSANYALEGFIAEAHAGVDKRAKAATLLIRERVTAKRALLKKTKRSKKGAK